MNNSDTLVTLDTHDIVQKQNNKQTKHSTEKAKDGRQDGSHQQKSREK